MKTIYLAGGCFWGMQRYFNQFEGITATEVGYANGPDRVPCYEEVCRGSGHAETLKAEYDESVISLERILEAYFAVIDPVAVNRQGNDEGVQYRTGIFYTDSSRLPVIRKALEQEEQKVGRPLAVIAEPLKNFFSAEEYHQNYLDKNPHGYCHIPPEYFSVNRKKHRAQ